MKLPPEIRQLLARRFEQRHASWLTAGGSDGDWPLTLTLGAPGEPATLLQADAVRAWADAWRGWRGPGQLQWVERRWRTLGTQSLPHKLVLDGPDQVASWIGQDGRWGRAGARAERVLARWPKLAPRLGRLFGVLADYEDADFERLLDLLTWLLAHPASGLYPRQLPVAGIDSKWLEVRKAVLVEWLTAARGAPPDEAEFYVVCGLRRPPLPIRLRILDPTLRARLGGLGDISAPLDELARLDLPATVLLIVENLQTGLALGDLAGTVAIMGLGYGVDALARLPWLPTAALYWGDIDTHGYAILQRARGYLPRLTSVLMDEATLRRFQRLCVFEKTQHGASELALLTEDEQRVYGALKRNEWGQQLRLEQERIAWDVAWPALVLAVRQIGPANQTAREDARSWSGDAIVKY
ncbi:MAG: Wadjet anti-phage system protein JetD domain-containing protein [Pseudomonadota bacterium]